MLKFLLKIGIGIFILSVHTTEIFVIFYYVEKHKTYTRYLSYKYSSQAI